MSTTAMPITTGPQIGLDVFSKAICLSVEIGCLGSTRKVPNSKIEVDADTTLIHVSKSLYKSEEFQAIKQFQASIRQRLYRVTLRPEIFRSGIYVLPLKLVEDTDQQLVEDQKTLAELVEKFCARYDEITALDAERLRSVSDDRDKPSLSKVRNSFYLTWSYIKFGVPDNLPEVLKMREAEKAAQQVTEAAEQMQQLLRAEMLDLVSHMADRLDSNKDGKPKIFRDSLVGNVKGFLELFEARNLTNDAALADLCSKAKQLLDGVDPQTLRDKEAIRDNVRKGFEAIKTQLDTLVVVDRPSRGIWMEEEG
jgi:hypothetical protein